MVADKSFIQDFFARTWRQQSSSHKRPNSVSDDNLSSCSWGDGRVYPPVENETSTEVPKFLKFILGRSWMPSTGEGVYRSTEISEVYLKAFLES